MDVTAMYLAGAAREQLTHAQVQVDRHITAGPDGRCRRCGEEQPCGSLMVAYDTFARYGRMPVRRPGLASRVVRECRRASDPRS